MRRITVPEMRVGWYKVWRDRSDTTKPVVFVNLKPIPKNWVGKDTFVVRIVDNGTETEIKEFVNLKDALTYGNLKRTELGIVKGWGVWIYDPDTTLVQKLSLQ